MIHAKKVTDLTALLALLGSLWYALRPTAYIPFVLCNLVFAASLAFSAMRMTPEERQRGRSQAVFIPVSTAAVGALWVWGAAPEDRLRATWMAATLLVIGISLAWARRQVR